MSPVYEPDYGPAATTGGRPDQEVARGSRPISPGIALILLVACSAVVRFAASLALDNPWIAPDEMLYALSGRSFWETGDLRLFDGSAPFYGLYPLLVGLPLHVFDVETGQVVFKAAQAILVSSIAAISYVWARRMAAPRWALLAAGCSAALPALAYSGLMMTEAAFLPAALLVLWLLARALETGTTAAQLLAVGAIALAVMARFQGIVLVPTFVASVLLLAWFARDTGVIRRFVPMLGALGVLAVGWILLRSMTEASTLGAYQEAAGAEFDAGEVLGWTWRTAGDFVLVLVFAPMVAALIMATSAWRGEEHDPAVQALLAAALTYALLTIVMVGAFASVYFGRLAERNLVSAAPALFVAFAVWLARGAPRPQPATSVVALLVAAPAVLLPVRDLISGGEATYDAFMTVQLLELLDWGSSWEPELVWSVAVVGVLLATVLLPRRALAWLAVGIVAALAATSIAAQLELEDSTGTHRAAFFGNASRSWIDGVADGPVLFLYDDAQLWNDVWHQAFWNERLTAVAALPGRTSLPGLPGGRAPRLRVLSDGGLVRADGTQIRERLIVTGSRLTVRGERVATIREDGFAGPLMLWRTNGRPALELRATGMGQSGYVTKRARVKVFSCDRGALEFTLFSEGGARKVTLFTPGFGRATIGIPPSRRWSGSIGAPHPSADGSCVFDIVPGGIVRLTRLDFVRGSAAHPGEVEGALVPIEEAAPAAGEPRFGYCLNGAFLNLLFQQPLRDPAYEGAVPASFVEGVGLTCGVPPGYRRRGFAGDAQGVPPGIYPYYVP